MGLQIERKQHEPQLEHGNLCLIDYQHLCVRERLCVCVSHTNIHSSYSHSHYTPTNHSTPLMHINSCAYLERTRTCMHGCTHARMRAHTPSHTQMQTAGIHTCSHTMVQRHSIASKHMLVSGTVRTTSSSPGCHCPTASSAVKMATKLPGGRSASMAANSRGTPPTTSTSCHWFGPQSEVLSNLIGLSPSLPVNER